MQDQHAAIREVPSSGSLTCDSPRYNFTRPYPRLCNFHRYFRFTRLTEKLTLSLDARKGVEALSQQLNDVYGALIDPVERHRGSVISFAGDSIIGWFEELHGIPSAAWRAVTCAQSMQSGMQQFKNLSWKVAVTSGPARRLVVGDPEIQLLDTLAGKTVAGQRLCPWLLKTVFEREHSGMVSFMTELRPAVPLFMNFSGIDYDARK